MISTSQERLGWQAASLHFIGMVAVLAVVLNVVPDPHPTDEYNMQRIGQHVLIPGCDDLNCFRILVPGIVESFPGPVLPRWRWYAVVGNAAGAIVTGELVLAFGLSRSVALLTMWLSAMGFGSMSMVYHPYTADSLMFVLCPLITLLILRGQLWLAALLATIGILGKEVAAAPLYIAALAFGIQRQWHLAARLLAIGIGVTAIWVAWQLALIGWLQYGYGPNPSVDIFRGGYFKYWLEHSGARNAAVAVFVEYGAIWILSAYGLFVAPKQLRAFAIAALPPAMALSYVQIPDRALWNFYYLWVPPAAMVLAALPALAGWIFTAMFGLANLRVGAQVMSVPQIRVPIAVTLVIAIVAIVTMSRLPRESRLGAAIP